MTKGKDMRELTLPCFAQSGYTTVCLFLSADVLSPTIITPSGSSSSISITSWGTTYNSEENASIRLVSRTSILFWYSIIVKNAQKLFICHTKYSKKSWMPKQYNSEENAAMRIFSRTAISILLVQCNCNIKAAQKLFTIPNTLKSYVSNNSIYIILVSSSIFTLIELRGWHSSWGSFLGFSSFTLTMPCHPKGGGLGIHLYKGLQGSQARC